jgi:hypothetical protein
VLSFGVKSSFDWSIYLEKQKMGWENYWGSTTGGAVVGSGVVYAGLLAVGLSSTGPIGGSWFAASQGAALASGTWMAALQSAAMTGAAVKAGAIAGAVGGAIHKWIRPS